MANKANPSGFSSWVKEHPFIFFCGALVGGAGFLISMASFAIVVVKDAILPTQTASLQNKITSLEDKIAYLEKQLNDDGGDRSTLKKRIEVLERDSRITKEQLAEAQVRGELFQPNSR